MKRGLFLILFVTLLLFISGLQSCNPTISIGAPSCCEALKLDGTTQDCVSSVSQTDCSTIYKGAGGYNFYNQECSAISITTSVDQCSSSIECTGINSSRISWLTFDSQDHSPNGQSFIPSSNIISGFSIQLSKVGTPGNIEYRIGSSFGASDVVSGYINSGDIFTSSATTKWINISFPTISIIPGRIYYLWLKPVSGVYPGNYYHISDYIDNPYKNGVIYYSGHQNVNGDLIFKTYNNENSRCAGSISCEYNGIIYPQEAELCSGNILARCITNGKIQLTDCSAQGNACKTSSTPSIDQSSCIPILGSIDQCSTGIPCSGMDSFTSSLGLDSQIYQPDGQSFIPSSNIISGFSIKLSKVGNPGNIEYRIGSNFGASDVASGYIDSSQINALANWINIIFPTKSIISGRTYYLWLKPVSGVASGNYYRIVYSSNTIYLNGALYFNGYPINGDLIFKTYSNQECDSSNLFLTALDSQTSQPHGQSFIPSSNIISGFSIQLSKVGNPGNIEYRIGTSFGASDVASGYIDSVQINALANWINIIFPTKSVISGRTYYLWLKPVSGVVSSDYYIINFYSNNLYPNGIGYYIYPNPSSTNDLAFKIFNITNHECAINTPPWINPIIPDHIVNGRSILVSYLNLTTYGHDDEDAQTALSWSVSQIHTVSPQIFHPLIFVSTVNSINKIIMITPVRDVCSSDHDIINLTVTDTLGLTASQNINFERRCCLSSEDCSNTNLDSDCDGLLPKDDYDCVRRSWTAPGAFWSWDWYCNFVGPPWGCSCSADTWNEPDDRYNPAQYGLWGMNPSKWNCIVDKSYYGEGIALAWPVTIREMGGIWMAYHNVFLQFPRWIQDLVYGLINFFEGVGWIPDLEYYLITLEGLREPSAWTWVWAGTCFKWDAVYAIQRDWICFEDTFPINEQIYFNWHDINGVNWMTDVKDQGGCGSCWAYSAVGAVEGVYNVQNNNPNLNLDLSEQELIDSSGAGSCNGGYNDRALWYIQHSGISSFSGYKYRSNYDIVDLDRTTIKYKLRTEGPISACLNWNKAIVFGADGIGRCSGRTGDMGHCIVLVGYNDASGYWIAKNSWGSDWGFENGYFNIGYGECQMETGRGYVSQPFNVVRM